MAQQAQAAKLAHRSPPTPAYVYDAAFQLIEAEPRPWNTPRVERVYVGGVNGSATCFRWVKAPTSDELTQLAHTMAQRIGHFLERQRLMERDIENSYLALDAADEDPMQTLLGHSITYRIAVGPQAGRKVFTLQTLPAIDQQDQFGDTVGKVAGFSLHAGVATNAHERTKLERPVVAIGLVRDIAINPRMLHSRLTRAKLLSTRTGTGSQGYVKRYV